MQQPLFQQEAAASFRLIVLLIASAVIMTVDHRDNHLQVVRSFISNAIYPIQYVVNAPARMASWSVEALTERRQLLVENAGLKNALLNLQAKQQKLEVLEVENQHLRALLGSSARVDQNVLVAEQIAVDLDPYKQQILIDKGTSENVYIGQPLIDANGIMGQIIHVSTNTSTALLISDPNHALPVEIVRNGLRSVIAGLGQTDAVELLHVPSSADVRIGDTLVTSGLGGRFPADYPVARINAIDHPPGSAFAQIYAQPTAALNRSREVLLVWHNEPESESNQETQASQNDTEQAPDS
ncbi:MAG: rod shape-determining protein MreC [Pseudomonadota bacterium]